MSRHGAAWIQLKDFVLNSCKISVTNTTTQMEVPGSFPIQVAEIGADQLVLRIPKNSCSKGHLLLVHLVRTRTYPKQQGHPPSEKLEVTITAKVTELETLEDGSLLAHAKFYQFQEAQWRKFLISLDRRQIEIDAIIRNIRD